MGFFADNGGNQKHNRLLGHQGPLWSLGFSANGTRIVSAGNDGAVLLWGPNGSEPYPPAVRLALRACQRPVTARLASDHVVIFKAMGVRSVPVVEAKAHFSALLAEVEAGCEVRITRRGRTVARLVPEPAISAASLFEPFWSDPPPDLEAPEDSWPEPAPQLG